LIVHLADPFLRRVKGRWRRQPRAFLAGTLSRPWQVRGGPRGRTVGIRFRPGSVTRFLAVDMPAAADREGLPGNLLGARFLAPLRDADRRGEVFPFLNGWLRERRDAMPKRSNDLGRIAVKQILRARGRERIRDLAARLGVHPRRLERAFATDLGIRPKL